MVCEGRSKKTKLLFPFFKRDLNLKGRLKQKEEQEKDGVDTHKYKTRRGPTRS